MPVNEFNIEPPSYDEEQGFSRSELPPNLDAAWILSLIKIKLPKELQDLLVPYVKPLLDVAARTNIKRHEITMHLLQYDLIWQRYQIYMRKGKFDSKLFVYKDIIRQAFEFQLNRSVEGWQGELVFTRRQVYDVKQKHEETVGDKMRGFIRNRKKNNNEEDYFR